MGNFKGKARETDEEDYSDEEEDPGVDDFDWEEYCEFTRRAYYEYIKRKQSERLGPEHASQLEASTSAVADDGLVNGSDDKEEEEEEELEYMDPVPNGIILSFIF